VKQWLLDMAEVMDAWRIFPRLILIAYGFMCGHLAVWYEALKVPTSEQSAFAGAIIAMATPLAGLYFNSGRDWTKKNEAHP